MRAILSFAGAVLCYAAVAVAVWGTWTRRLDLIEALDQYEFVPHDDVRLMVRSLPAGSILLYGLIGALVVEGIESAGLPEFLAMLIGAVSVLMVVAGLALAVTVVVFNWPKRIVPPHLRGDRGLLQGKQASMRAHDPRPERDRAGGENDG